MKPDTVVELHNKGTKKFEGRWDGKPFIIEKGKHKEVVKGLADHFITVNPKAKLEIQEIEVDEPEKRDPENPLEENNRGKSFEELDGDDNSGEGEGE